MSVQAKAKRAAAGALAKALLPTRARISVALYDRDGGRSFRGLPGYAIIVDVNDREELSRLWFSVEAFIQEGTWRRAPMAVLGARRDGKGSAPPVSRWSGSTPDDRPPTPAPTQSR